MNKIATAALCCLLSGPAIAQSVPPPDSLTALQQQAARHGYSNLYLRGVSFFVQSAIKTDLGHQTPLIRYKPNIDDAFILTQIIGKKYAIFQHRPIPLDLTLIHEMNAQLAGVILAVPLEKGRQYITGAPLGGVLGGDQYLAYKGTVDLTSPLGAHITAMVFVPARL